MHHCAVHVDDQICRATADVVQRHADFALVCRQHRERAGEWLEHHFSHVQVHALGTLDDVLDCMRCGRDEMTTRFETHATHADGLGNSIVSIDQEFLRQHMQDLTV